MGGGWGVEKYAFNDHRTRVKSQKPLLYKIKHTVLRPLTAVRLGDFFNGLDSWKWEKTYILTWKCIYHYWQPISIHFCHVLGQTCPRFLTTGQIYPIFKKSGAKVMRNLYYVIAVLSLVLRVSSLAWWKVCWWQMRNKTLFPPGVISLASRLCTMGQGVSKSGKNGKIWLFSACKSVNSSRMRLKMEGKVVFRAPWWAHKIWLQYLQNSSVQKQRRVEILLKKRVF